MPHFYRLCARIRYLLVESKAFEGALGQRRKGHWSEGGTADERRAAVPCEILYDDG